MKIEQRSNKLGTSLWWSVQKGFHPDVTRWRKSFPPQHTVSVKNTFHWKSAGNLRKQSDSSCQKWELCHDKQQVENVDNSLQLKLLCLRRWQKTPGVGGDWLTRAQLILSLSIWDVKFLPVHEPRLVIQEKHPSRLRLPPLQTQKANVSALFNVRDTFPRMFTQSDFHSQNTANSIRVWQAENGWM